LNDDERYFVKHILAFLQLLTEWNLAENFVNEVQYAKNFMVFK
jgi:hypothetical protein